jgi:hypothetical protein
MGHVGAGDDHCVNVLPAYHRFRIRGDISCASRVGHPIRPATIHVADDLQDGSGQVLCNDSRVVRSHDPCADECDPYAQGDAPEI